MRLCRNLLSLGTLICLILCAATSAISQTDAAMVSGQIVDHSGAIVRGASVELHSTLQSTSSTTVTNDAGIYVFPSIQPGPYTITVRKQGFKQVDLVDLVLNTQAHVEQNFKLEVGSASESITVTANSTNDSPAVSMTVEREFVENMPLNGESFQDLIQLAPGTVSDEAGDYTVNGQRADSNIYTVDGVSANLGGVLSGVPEVGTSLSGFAPAQTALGTTQSLASIDSLQEFTIQTSGYSAEYGRSPGGQVQFTTRSGSNSLHGSVSEYLRNTAFDANSFYNDYYTEPKSAEHQNDFGGTVGGPVIVPRLYNGHDKTFYFLSYEGLRLLLPSSESKYVPTQAFRNWASPNVQPFLNAVPLPNPSSQGNNDGCTITDPSTGQSEACDALFYTGYSYPNKVDAIGVRVDENLGHRGHVFLRYSDTPSSELPGVETVISQIINTHTWTAGLTTNLTTSLVGDFRFNYSYNNEQDTYAENAKDGAVPTQKQLVEPEQYFTDPSAGAETYVAIPGYSLSALNDFGGSASIQHQYQLLDSVSWSRGKHGMKFGVDWRRLTPTYQSGSYFDILEILSLTDIQAGNATAGQISSHPVVTPVFDNLSVYAQDHWAFSPRLSIDYGLRWEFNPPPGPANGLYPVALTSSNIATTTVAPSGTEIYKTSYDHFAPRVGFAWNAIPSHKYPLTVRGGFGIFYDTAQSLGGELYTNNYPYSASKTFSEAPLPLSSSVLSPPSPSAVLTPPYPSLGVVMSPELTLPYTEQWNLSFDEALNQKNTLTASYVGNVGRKLLFTQYLSGDPYGNPNLSSSSSLSFTSNSSQSSYNALQVQDIGRLSVGLDLVGSFTWAHALDNASTDDSVDTPVWGNSNYDLRRVLNLALNYQTFKRSENRWLRSVTGDWLLADRFSAQSGYPINIRQANFFFPATAGGGEALYQPDLVPNVPIYLHGSAANVNGNPVPGNWRLNRAAFACTPTNSTTPCRGTPTRQGTLGRNYIRTPSFWTLNTALQRSFPIHEQVHLQFRADAFNIFNHPNLTSPDLGLTDSTFGELNGGAVTTIGSPNTLYAMGAARSLQFSLKLQF
jgi:hypothetical protein